MDIDLLKIHTLSVKALRKKLLPSCDAALKVWSRRLAALRWPPGSFFLSQPSTPTSMARSWIWPTSLLEARMWSATPPRGGSCVAWTSGPMKQSGSCQTTPSLVRCTPVCMPELKLNVEGLLISTDFMLLNGWTLVRCFEKSHIMGKKISGWFNHIRLPQPLFIASPPGLNPLPAELFFCGGHF